ncbi:MAG: hypothetical protein M1837_003484 [Sclerophora amabilis]|nr:MAG: hypothetical protein M1837_003484 [Sclerophora amabilis]
MDEIASEGCHHYYNIGEVPWDIQKYWAQRHSIFSLYDRGVWMTDDAWFGVTPEPIANKIAEHMVQSTPGNQDVLIDAFAGAGGNTIAFARSGRWKKVVAIEKDADVLQCAKHNARLYGVEKNIEWFQGDCFEILANMPADLRSHSAIFASPPWGGQSYRSEEIVDLSTLQPYSLKQLYDSLGTFCKDLVLYLPRTSDLRQLAEFVPEDKQVRVVHYCIRGASKVSFVRGMRNGGTVTDPDY